MISRGQKLRLGLFLTVSMLSLAIFIVYIAGQKLIEKRDLYKIRFTDTSVGGLQIGSSVKYHGVTIGQVDEFAMDPEDVTSVIIIFSVKEETPIKSDTRATLSPVGITGMMQIELVGGSNEAKNLKPGEFVQAGSSTFETITGKAESISQNIELVLANIAELTNEKSRNYVEDFLKNLSHITDVEMQTELRLFISQLNQLVGADTQEKLSQTITEIESFSQKLSQLNLEKPIKSADRILSENRGALKSAITNLDSSTSELKKFVGSLNETSVSLSESAKRIQKILEKPEFDEIVDNAAVISRQIANAHIDSMILNINDAVNQANEMFNHVDLIVLRSRTDLLRTIESLKETASYLYEFSRKVSEDPSLILRSTK
ncbi:MAG TPA: MCE family protein [Candidatus Marinimicrobia bacterium]|nr:MCE family protein [Candidatus Neomarinimicrobiota bacterium]